ncbi:hypothetical protein H8B09_22495 [Paenibacillus sp. PR3]|uniref:PH domain-containing protein n=1 Tax=Paenibacillus terricola TaxID=2763503 RepID=A0ABR8N2W5_9BACL|nr:hypothetical protein [Paenibacillus terricola]MBD3921555.1 hypothetical protein [Paenibacillus terricola]
MLIGKHSSKLLGLLVLFIFLFGYLTYEKFDLYFSLAPSENRGLKLFLSICNLIFVLYLFSLFRLLYFKKNTVEWKQGYLYLNGSRVILGFQSITRLDPSMLNIKFNSLWSMKVLGEPSEITAFINQAAQDFPAKVSKLDNV